MKFANIEFAVFDAQDVIATSTPVSWAGKNMYVPFDLMNRFNNDHPDSRFTICRYFDYLLYECNPKSGSNTDPVSGFSGEKFDELFGKSEVINDGYSDFYPVSGMEDILAWFRVNCVQ